jgi:hypothetical protein
MGFCRRVQRRWRSWRKVVCQAFRPKRDLFGLFDALRSSATTPPVGREKETTLKVSQHGCVALVLTPAPGCGLHGH